MIDFSEALSRVSDLLDAHLNWAITGGANLSLRSGSRTSNDLDIICSRKDMPRIVGAIFNNAFVDKKSTCGNIRSVFHAEDMCGIRTEIMGGVENRICGAWVPNQLFLECIERDVVVGGFSVNLMSVAYEIHINALIGNEDLCARFVALEVANSSKRP